MKGYPNFDVNREDFPVMFFVGKYPFTQAEKRRAKLPKHSWSLRELWLYLDLYNLYDRSLRLGHYKGDYELIESVEEGDGEIEEYVLATGSALEVAVAIASVCSEEGYTVIPSDFKEDV